MKKRILIADMDTQFCRELTVDLKKHDEFEVIGMAFDGEKALQMLQAEQPDILVMDPLLPKVDGLTVLEQIRDMHIHPKILIISAFINQYVVTSAARLGAHQFLMKPCNIDGIVKNILRMDMAEKGEPTFFPGNQDLASLVTNTLHKIGVPANLKGHQYLREAIILTVEDEDDEAVLKCRYKEVANKFQTTTKRVESAIRHAVECAWDRGDLDTLQRFFGYTVSNVKGKPTNTEFISLVADQIRLTKKNPEQCQ